MTVTDEPVGDGSGPPVLQIVGPPLEVRLEETRRRVDRTLESMPDNRLEARRLITRELGFEPRPEALQTIVKLAHDPVAEGAIAELSRRLLALRILVDHELKQLLESRTLDPVRIRRSAEIMPDLLQAAQAIEGEISHALESLSLDERDLLLQIGNSMTLPRDKLVAAAVVGPRLGLLATAAEEGLVQAAVPCLEAAEVEIFSSAIQGEDGPSRVFVDALALKTVILDDLEMLESLRDVDGDEAAVGRTAVLDRLRQDKIAYHVLSERLQEHQDSALLAGLNDFADEMRQAQRDLFSVHLKLAPALRTVAAGPDRDDDGEEGVSLERLLQECSVADALVDTEHASRLSKEELYLDALGGKRSEPQIIILNEKEVRRAKLRMRVLGSVAVTLLVATVGLYAFMFRTTPPDALAPPQEMPRPLILNQMQSVGPLMYATVNDWHWEDLTNMERLRKVEQVGELAREQGYEAVYLVDDTAAEVATWTLRDGAKLALSLTPADAPAQAGN